jgi:hypothetical protein
LSRQAQYTGGFANTWHAGYDDMGHIAIFRYDLQSLNRLCISDHVVEEDWPVFLDPDVPNLAYTKTKNTNSMRTGSPYHGNS